MDNIEIPSHSALSKSLTKRYIIALLLVASFSTASWISQDLVIQTEKETALVVNISGRQRMLSQRTALFSNLLAITPASGQQEVRRQLKDAIELMKQSHRGLTQGDANIGLTGRMSLQVRAMYFDGNNSLNQQVVNYIGAVEAYLQLASDEINQQTPQLLYITRQAPNQLLTSLDAMVKQYQVEGENSINEIESLGIIFWCSTLLLLLLEAMLIFYPFVGLLRRVIGDLHEVKNNLDFQSKNLEELVNTRTSELQLSQNFTQDILDSLPIEIAVIDSNGVIIGVNDAWCDFAKNNGYIVNEAVPKSGMGCNYINVCQQASSTEPGSEISDTSKAIKAVLAGDLPYFDLEYPCDAQNQKRWFYMTVSPMKTLGSGAVVAHMDITGRKLAEEGLGKFFAAVENSSAAVIITDLHATIEYVNPRFTLDTGYEANEAIGKNPSMLSSGLSQAELYDSLWASLMAGQAWHGEFINRKKNGDIYWEDAYIAPVKNAQHEITHYVGIITDISERKQLEAKIHQLAFNDELTGLPNRRLLREHLGQMQAFNQRSGCYGAVIFLDLDNFKSLNDQHGHAVGDLLLIEVAARLKNSVRNADTVARMGGDEFVVLLSELATDAAESHANAQQIAQKILNAISMPYSLNVTSTHATANVVQHNCSASIGVFLFLGNQLAGEKLLDNADKAMYMAKTSGGHQIRFYSATNPQL